MKDSSKQTKIGVTGLILTIALFALCIFLFKNSNQWIVYAILTIGLSCFIGSLMYIFDGIHGFISGAITGAIPMISLIFVLKLSKPYNGIFCAIGIILLFTVPTIKEYLYEREITSRKPKIKLIANKIKKYKEIEEKETAESKEINESINIGKKSLILKTLWGSFFQCIKAEDKYYFIYIGDEVKGVDFKLIIRDFSDEKIYITKKKDFIINKCEISSVTYNADKLKNSFYANSGSIILHYKNNKKRFHVMDNIAIENIKMFFEGIKISLKSHNAQKNLPIAETKGIVDKKLINKLKSICLLLTIFSAVDVALFFFTSVNYKVLSLICILLFLITFGLYVKYNKIFSIDDSSKVFSKNKINITLPLFISSLGLGLCSLLDFNLLSFKMLIELSVLFSAIILFIFFRFTKEYKRKKSIMFMIMFMLLYFAPAAVVQTNYIFDKSDSKIETSKVYDMRIEKGSKGPDRYYVKVNILNGRKIELDVSKEYYEDLKIGSTVYVVERDGFLKIPYAYIE